MQFTRFYKENFGSVSTSDKPTFRAVNVHAHNGCNLACKGCNHNSSVLGVGSSVRARIVSLSPDTSDPRRSKIGLTCKQTGLGSHEWIHEDQN